MARVGKPCRHTSTLEADLARFSALRAAGDPALDSGCASCATPASGSSLSGARIFLVGGSRNSAVILCGGIACDVGGITKWLFGFGLTCQDANEVGHYRPRNERPQPAMKLT
jgi:hypothetical protein